MSNYTRVIFSFRSSKTRGQHTKTLDLMTKRVSTRTRSEKKVPYILAAGAAVVMRRINMDMVKVSEEAKQQGWCQAKVSVATLARDSTCLTYCGGKVNVEWGGEVGLWEINSSRTPQFIRSGVNTLAFYGFPCSTSQRTKIQTGTRRTINNPHLRALPTMPKGN